MSVRTRRGRFRPRKLLAGALAGMMGLLLAIPSSHADTTGGSSGASGAINIHRQGDEFQKSGTDFQYQIDVSSSDVDGDGALEEASIFIPFDEGINPDWEMSVVTSDANNPVTGEKEAVGYRITFENPIAAGVSTAVRFTVKPPSGWTPDGTTWTVDPILEFTQGGEKNAEKVDTSISSTATAEASVDVRKMFGSNMYASSSNWTTDPESTYWMRITTSTPSGVNPGQLLPKPGSIATLQDVLPEGMEINWELLDDDRVKYDPETRLLTADLEIYESSYDGQTLVPSLSVPLKDTTNTPSGESTRLTNTATVAVEFIGEDDTIEDNGTARVTLNKFIPGGSLFSKSSTTNASAVGSPSNSSRRYFMQEDQSDQLVRYTLEMRSSSRAGYRAKVYDAFPCYSNETSGGYQSPAYGSGEVCDDPVMDLKSIDVWHQGHGVDQLDITLYLENGEEEVVTVDLDEGGRGSVDIDSHHTVVAIEYEAIIDGSYSRIMPLLSIPTDERLPHGTIIHNRGYAKVANLDADYGNPHEYSTFDIIYRDAPKSQTDTRSVAIEVDANGETSRLSRAVFGATVKSVGGNLQTEKARHLVLLPSPDTGLTIRESSLNVLEREFGDRFTYYENYEGTGLPAVEVVGHANGLIPFSTASGIFFTPKGAKPGVYDFHVYSGYDGQSKDQAVCTSTGGTYDGADSTVVTPDFWPVADTAVCHTPGTITITTPTDSFALDKQIREDSNDLWQGYTGKPIGTENGSAEFNLTFANTGPNDLQDVVFYDMLPTPGDTGTVAGQTDTSRGTTARAVLTAPVEAPEGFTVYYSTSENPQRDRVNPDLEGTVDDWSADVPSDLSKVTALKFDGGDTRLKTGESVAAVVTVAFEDETGVAWNTVSGDADVAGQPGSLLPVEPRKVGFRMNAEPGIVVEKNELGDDEIEVEGGENTVTVKFTNDGTDDLTDFKFTDTTESGEDVVWNEDELAGLEDLVLKPGESYEINGTVEVILGTQHRDVAKVEATGVISGEPVEDDDPTTLIPDDPVPAIVVEKNERGDDIVEAVEGENTVTVKFTNNGTDDLTDFKFTDTTEAGNDVVWNREQLDGLKDLVLKPKESYEIEGIVEVELGITHRDVAKVEATGVLSGEPIEGEDPTTYVPEDPVPSIKVTKNEEGDDVHDIDSGDHGVEVTIENNGEEDLRNFTFKDITQSGEEVEWNQRELDGLKDLVLKKGESYTVTGNVEVIMGTTHRDTVDIQAEGVITGNTVRDDDPTTLVPEDPETDIVVEKNVAGDDVHDIESGVHEVTVKFVNLGTEDLTDFVFTDTTESGEDVVWNEDEINALADLVLPPGESYTITGEVEVIMGTTHRDTAKVEATGVISGDTVEHEDPTTLIPEDPVTEILVEKNKAGEDIHHIDSGDHEVTVSFTNKGTEDLTDFVFTDTTESGEDVEWSKEDLEGLEGLTLKPGESYTISGEVTVVMGTAHRDVATVEGTGVISGDTIEGDDPTTLIPEDPETSLIVEKNDAGDDVTDVDPGEHDVVVRITNDGTEALTDFTFTDITESGKDVVWNEEEIDGLEGLTLEPGESYIITGTVEVVVGEDHRDTAVIDAVGVISGDPFVADDPTTFKPIDPVVPADEDPLAKTGASTPLILGGIGAMLLIAGVGAVYVTRRNRKA